MDIGATEAIHRRRYSLTGLQPACTLPDRHREVQGWSELRTGPLFPPIAELQRENRADTEGSRRLAVSRHRGAV